MIQGHNVSQVFSKVEFVFLFLVLWRIFNKEGVEMPVVCHLRITILLAFSTVKAPLY